MTKDELIEYVYDEFGVEPEYLWEKYPDAFVFRHRGNRKWFGVSMDVRRGKLGLSGDGTVWLLDTKCGPVLSGSYIGKPGILPAWHMNKSYWISALLDGTAAREDIQELLRISFELTNK